MKKMVLSLLLLAAVALVFSACSPNTAQALPTPEVSRPQGLIAEARLQPVDFMEQAFTIPGTVAEVLVEDGEAVTAGQPLARLSDSPDARAALVRAQQEALQAQQALDALSASADLALAQARLAVLDAQKAADQAQDRYEANDSDENKAKLDVAVAALAAAEDTLAKLEEGEGVDPDQRAAAEARLASANASITSAQALLDALTLRASMDGTVVDLSLRPGQQVTAGMPVLMLADFSSWVVKTDNLTELEVANIELGQSVQVTLDALPDSQIVGEVAHINMRYEEKRGDITYTVTILLNQVDVKARWGMTAAVYFAP